MAAFALPNSGDGNLHQFLDLPYYPVEQYEPRKKTTVTFHLCWLFNRDPDEWFVIIIIFP